MPFTKEQVAVLLKACESSAEVDDRVRRKFMMRRATANLMDGDNAARALVNETEAEELEFRNRFIDVIR